MSTLDYQTPSRSNRFGLNANVLPLLVTCGVLVLMYALGGVLYYDRNFLSGYNAANLIEQNAVLGVAAIGATFVILAGGIDLSVGAVVAFTTIFIARTVDTGWHPFAAWAVALALGTALGLAMGLLIHYFDLPAFMVTLAGMFFARAMAFVAFPRNLAVDHPLYKFDGLLQSLNLPLPGRASLSLIAVICLICYAVSFVVAQYTSFGRYVYAVGGDEDSARLLGVPVARTRVATYTIAGFCSALAGVMATVLKSSGDPSSYVGMELDAIAAVVIGGTLITGGVGFIVGSLAGTLIQGLIQTLIIFQGNISSWWTKIVVGLLVLGFIVLQRLLLKLTSPQSESA